MAIQWGHLQTAKMGTRWAHLVAARAARKEYAMTHPEDIEKIRALEEKVKQKRRCKPRAKRGL